MILTYKNLHDAGGPAGCAFTKAQLSILGVEWPPAKGWLTSQIGREIPDETYEAFKEAYKITSKNFYRKYNNQASMLLRGLK